DRADVDDVAGQFGLDRLADIRTDLQVLAAAHAAQLVGAGDLAGEAHSARALDAAGHFGGDQRPEILVCHGALALGEARDAAAVAQRHVLQLALDALVADRAVERMVDQQELHHVFLELQRLVRARHHLHAFRYWSSTRRLRLGHHATAHLDIHQAHAAVGGDRQLAVIAEARDRHADRIGSLDDHRALADPGRLAVDLDVDQVGGLGGGLRAHAATSVAVLANWSSVIERPCSTKYSNSFQKRARKPCTGQAAASPNAQIVCPSI